MITLVIKLLQISILFPYYILSTPEQLRKNGSLNIACNASDYVGV
jgi:hypothetical protein